MRETSNSAPKISIAEYREAGAAGLNYVSDDERGFTRIRRGKKFSYLTPAGAELKDPRELQRIAKLAIPPAYKDVWISLDPRGHLQATGRDARGRKQYRYHAEWRTIRDRAKFDRMVEFGAALPRLRRRVSAGLALQGLPREKVLATIASLLDTTGVRIGNAEYARSNKSFGLTTLLNRHVKFLAEGRALFRFRGKSGVQHEVAIDDRRLVQIVRRCQELPGQKLFQFTDSSGVTRGIGSSMVNDYLREVMGFDCTAKDFRTWSATVRAIELLLDTPLPARPSERARQRCILHVVRKVAAELRNTPAVCRKSYINPVVFAAWENGTLQNAFSKSARRSALQLERAVYRFLKRKV